MTYSSTTPTTGLTLPHLVNYSSSSSTAGSPSCYRDVSPTPGPRAKRPRLQYPTPKVTAANLNHVHVRRLREDSFVNKAFLHLEGRVAELEAEKKGIIAAENENESENNVAPERESAATSSSSSSSTAANLDHARLRRLREDDSFVEKAFLYIEGRVAELEAEKKEEAFAAVGAVAENDAAEDKAGLESAPEAIGSSTSTITVTAATAVAAKDKAEPEPEITSSSISTVTTAPITAIGATAKPDPKPKPEPEPEATNSSSSSISSKTSTNVNVTKTAGTPADTSALLTADTTLQTSHSALKLAHIDLISRNADLQTQHSVLQASHSALKLAHADLTSRHAALSKLHEMSFDPEAELDYYFGKQNF